jgi:hypothetical protein
VFLFQANDVCPICSHKIGFKLTVEPLSRLTSKLYGIFKEQSKD